MKRTRLERRTPLERKTGIRPVSKKRAKRQRETNPARRAYVARVWLCECCAKREATDCHEITNGPNRDTALSERCCWLAVCSECNCHRLTDKAEYPLARQLKLKLLADPEHFDLARVLEILGYSSSYLSLKEVKACQA